MKTMRMAAAGFTGTLLLIGGTTMLAHASDEPSDDAAIAQSDDSDVEAPDVEAPDEQGDDQSDDEGEDQAEDEGDEVEGDEDSDEPGGAEAAAQHREAMALWKECVDAAVDAAPTAEEPIDVLAQCGTKPHPPGKANGWDGAKVSKNAQHKVDKAAAGEHVNGQKPEKPGKAKEKKGNGHRH